MKCKDYKKGEKCKDGGIKWCKTCKDCKKIWNCCKDSDI